MTCARIFEVALRTAAWAVCVTTFDGIVNITGCSTDVVSRQRGEAKLETGC